ncbi:DUF1499 domain-containing protein [Parvularcula oceani]|uniref:DUF1499 domain-containing protein n=1 Tax=Parvularcula oceani TaxID=1247963 RepID=UPI000560C2AE|nr:DUF1499 domain-containing protein [Parvularcula oceani]
MRAAALVLVLLALVPVLIYGGMSVGVRYDLIGFGALFSQLGWLVPVLLVAGVAALVSFVLMLLKRALLPAAASFCVCLLAFGMAAGPILLRAKAATVPPIHDITTDTVNPPAFVAVLPLREGAANPPEYDRSQTEAQLEAYPQIRPLVIERPYQEVYPLVIEALRAEGMRIVAADPREGRIEAVATTSWFGFRDDVVLRLRGAHGIATLIDMRSKSRVGRSDVGANAERIERVFGRITEEAA